MRKCSKCGKEVEFDANKCPDCGSIALIFQLDTPQPEPVSAPDASAPGLPEQPEPAAQEDIPALRLWMKEKWFWPAVGGTVLLLGLGGWWAFAPKPQPSAEIAAAEPVNAVEAGERAQIEALIHDALAEKLEWGRELLKKRMPNRFPEELLLDTNKAEADLQYANPEKTAVVYHLPVTYHFKELSSKAYIWLPASFTFIKRDGKWALAGDKWPNEWDVNFE